MSRGGRGGGRFYGGRPRAGPTMPFEVDPELLEAVDQAEDEERSSDEDRAKDLFPDVLSPIPSAPITAREHRAVVLQREIQARRHAGPFWTGTMEQWAEIDTHSGGQVNAFDGGVVATYGRKRVRKPFTLPSLKKVKVCYADLLPKELKDVATDNSPDGANALKKKRLARKSAADRLARLDEEDPANLGLNDRGAASDEENEKGEDDEDDPEREPEDDDFTEDEEDDDDYNAEKYFNDGDGDFDEPVGGGGGGDDYGGDDAY